MQLSKKVRRIIKVEDPLECIILERINRFVVKVLLDGKPRRSYINNTGRLLEYLVKGKKGFCIRNGKTGKTDCRLFSIEEDGFGAIIDTQLQMKVLEKAQEMRLIPWIKKCRIGRRNVRLGRSLIDYLLNCRRRKVYLEVKSAVLRQGEYAVYPDCPSARGRKHVEELTDHVRKGGRGIMLFVAALPQVKAFRPNKSMDSELCELLREAYESGVIVRSIGLHYNPEDSSIYLYNPDLEVRLF